MTILLRFWREILILILGLASYYLYSHPIEVIKELPRIVEVEKVVTKTVVKTIVTKPDGTTIVKEEQQDTTSDKVADKVVTPIVKLNPYRYSVGMLVKFDYNDNDKKNYVIDVGARIADSPLVVALSYDITPKTFALGVRYEF